MQFSLLYAPDVFDLRGKIMGRQSAGHGFLRAVLQAKPERIWCYAASRAQAETFGRDVRDLSPSPPELRFIGWDQPAKLAQTGLLYRADPGIAAHGWQRRQHTSTRAYSICGVTHTLSTQAAMTVIQSLLRAPVYSWDALICTSSVARDVLRHILETEMEHLRARFGATRFTLPQLPLIPLGTHAKDFEYSDAARATARACLAIGAEDVAALFAGRLTFHGKAHPLPMFLGLQQAAVQSGRRVHLILFGKFPNDHIAKAFKQEAAQFASAVNLIILDGDSTADRDAAWAAADLFTSLSDNVQETFGLTPIEAMAAGLPLVVSDWNGYKDSVRDGIDGFRIPTALPPSGAGLALADRYDMRLDDYDRYVGGVAQFTAVDVGATAKAYLRLIESADLRRQMGAAGRRRVAEHFDWAVVFRRYIALWEELAERRRADPAMSDETSRIGAAERLDPFALFDSYPTRVLSGESLVRLCGDATLAMALERRKLDSVGYAEAVLPPEDLITRTITSLPPGEWLSLAGLATACRVRLVPGMVLAAAWLAKMGLIEIQ